MGARIIQHDPLPQIPSRGRAFVYVLPSRDEEILKIGFSRDPLERMQTLHRRYFEFFDLDRGLLLQTDSVRDARKLERYLAAGLQDHRAPSPITIRRSAAGHTEWFRGAYPQVAERAFELAEAQGFELHAPLRTWVALRLIERSGLLFHWSARMLDLIEIAGPEQSAGLDMALRDMLDAYDELALSVDDFVGCDVAAWYLASKG